MGARAKHRGPRRASLKTGKLDVNPSDEPSLQRPPEQSTRGPRVRLGGQIAPSNTKPHQANPNNIAWICSGLFNGLWRNKQKIVSSFSAPPSVSRYADSIRRLGKGIATVGLVVGSGNDGRGGAARHILQLRCVVRGEADMVGLGVPWICGLTIEKSRSAEGKFLDFASFSFGFFSSFLWISFLRLGKRFLRSRQGAERFRANATGSTGATEWAASARWRS
jgi:hypothetical protein